MEFGLSSRSRAASDPPPLRNREKPTGFGPSPKRILAGEDRGGIDRHLRGNVVGMVLDVVGRKFIPSSNKTASRVGLGVGQQKSEVKTPGFFLSAFGKGLGREDGHGWMAGL